MKMFFRCQWPIDRSLLSLSILFLFFLLCRFDAIASNDVGSKSSVPKPTLTKVFVSKVQSVELHNVLTYPAQIQSKINTVILAEADGVLSEMKVSIGQVVKKGQILIVLKHTDPVYQYAPIPILSTIEGVISSLDVSLGTQVNKGQKLMTILDPNKIKIMMEIPASDLGLLTKGTLGSFQPSNQTKQYFIRVRGISPWVDPTTGTATAEAELMSGESNGKGYRSMFPAVLPGFLGKVTFKVQSRKGVLVPDSAISFKGEIPFVRWVENGQVRKTNVKLGPRQRGYVEVLEGLSEKMTLIVRASKTTAEGEKVEAEEVPPEAESSKVVQ